MIRPTQSSTFSLVSRGLNFNFTKLAFAQERVATGKAILRPSDDAVGTARSLSMRRQLGQLDRYRDAVSAGRPILETSTAALENASGLITEARSLLITALSGSLSPNDRETIGRQIEQIVAELVDVGNTKIGDRYVFAGTETSTRPFTLSSEGSAQSVSYNGNDAIQSISVGFGAELQLNLPGSELFGTSGVQGVEFAGLSGVQLGTSANQGEGYASLDFRHDATVGSPGSGVALVAGGASDTILGAHNLSIDATAGTVTLDGGAPLTLPQPTDPDYADFVVTDETGAELHLDFTGYTGASSTATLTGDGSVSLNGGAFTALTYTETDLELHDPSTGTVLHLDTTGVRRAGEEPVSFTGATDIFGVLGQAASDLINAEGLSSGDVVDRVQLRFGELEDNLEQVLKGLGTLGGHTERMVSSAERLESLSLNVESLLSQVEDVDLAQAVLEMTKSEQTLQVAQATGSRLIQNTLLNYLR